MLISKSVRALASAIAIAYVLAGGATLHARELAEIVEHTSVVEKIAGDCRFTEGPAYSTDGYLLFSDIPNSRIVRVGKDGRRERLSQTLGPC